MNEITWGKALLLLLQFGVRLKGVGVKQVRLEAMDVSRGGWMAVVGRQGGPQLERSARCSKIMGLTLKVGSHPARCWDEICDFGLSEL